MSAKEQTVMVEVEANKKTTNDIHDIESRDAVESSYDMRMVHLVMEVAEAQHKLARESDIQSRLYSRNTKSNSGEVNPVLDLAQQLRKLQDQSHKGSTKKLFAESAKDQRDMISKCHDIFDRIMNRFKLTRNVVSAADDLLLSLSYYIEDSNGLGLDPEIITAALTQEDYALYNQMRFKASTNQGVVFEVKKILEQSIVIAYDFFTFEVPKEKCIEEPIKLYFSSTEKTYVIVKKDYIHTKCRVLVDFFGPTAMDSDLAEEFESIVQLEESTAKLLKNASDELLKCAVKCIEYVEKQISKVGTGPNMKKIFTTLIADFTKLMLDAQGLEEIFSYDLKALTVKSDTLVLHSSSARLVATATVPSGTPESTSATACTPSTPKLLK